MSPPIQTTQDSRPPNTAIPNVRKLSWAQIIRPRSAATIPNPIHTSTPTHSVAQSRPTKINGEPSQAAQSHTHKPSSFDPGPLIEGSAAMPGNTPANPTLGITVNVESIGVVDAQLSLPPSNTPLITQDIKATQPAKSWARISSSLRSWTAKPNSASTDALNAADTLSQPPRISGESLQSHTREPSLFGPVPPIEDATLGYTSASQKQTAPLSVGLIGRANAQVPPSPSNATPITDYIRAAQLAKSWALDLSFSRSSAITPNPAIADAPNAAAAQSQPARTSTEPSQRAQLYTHEPSSFGPRPPIKDTDTMPTNIPANESNSNVQVSNTLPIAQSADATSLGPIPAIPAPPFGPTLPKQDTSIPPLSGTSAPHPMERSVNALFQTSSYVGPRTPTSTTFPGPSSWMSFMRNGTVTPSIFQPSPSPKTGFSQVNPSIPNRQPQCGDPTSPQTYRTQAPSDGPIARLPTSRNQSNTSGSPQRPNATLSPAAPAFQLRSTTHSTALTSKKPDGDIVYTSPSKLRPDAPSSDSRSASKVSTTSSLGTTPETGEPPKMLAARVPGLESAKDHDGRLEAEEGAERKAAEEKAVAEVTAAVSTSNGNMNRSIKVGLSQAHSDGTMETAAINDTEKVPLPELILNVPKASPEHLKPSPTASATVVPPSPVRTTVSTPIITDTTTPHASGTGVAEVATVKERPSLKAEDEKDGESTAAPAPNPAEPIQSKTHDPPLLQQQPPQTVHDLTSEDCTFKLLGLDGRSPYSLRGTEAAEAGTKLHSFLRTCSSDPTAYTNVLKVLQDLCAASEELPSCYKLQNVTFNRRDVIGRGGEASIYSGEFNGQKVALREVVMPQTYWRAPAGRNAIKLINREVITHSQLEHPNIVPLLGVFCESPDTPPLMVLPLVERGCLANMIADEVIHGAEFARIIVGVGRALAYLHSREPPIFHGDLHPKNILIDAIGNALVCDFGLSRICHEVTRTHTTIREGGRVRFMAPELLSGEDEKFRTSSASDIFSLSMTFLNVWTRECPFAKLSNDVKVEAAIRRRQRPHRPTIRIALPPATEQEFWALLVDMWAHEPFRRVSTEEMQSRLETIFSPLYGQL